MTDPNKTHVTMLVDRSNSMGRHKAKAEEAINAYFAELKEVDKPCSVLLIDYDAPGFYAAELDPWYRTIHSGDLKTVPQYELRPRGNTALLDAMSMAIDETGAMLAKLPEKKRPGTVIFVTQTDGEENHSTMITQLGINEKIARQENQYQWTFVFLGVGPQAWSMGQRFVGTRMMGNQTRSADSDMAYGSTYSVVASATNVARSRGHGAGGQSVNWAASVADDGTVTKDEDKADVTP